MSKEVKRIIIAESDWQTSIYRTVEWEQTVNIVRWEHDYVKKIYIIDFTVLFLKL